MLKNRQQFQRMKEKSFNSVANTEIVQEYQEEYETENLEILENYY